MDRKAFSDHNCQETEGSVMEVGDLLLNKYKLVRVLGEGGMGLVFEASHEVLGKRVAVKSLHADLSSDEQLVQRFFREARAAAAIGHRSIIDVYDVGQENGSTFLVMEYLEGQTLSERLSAQGPLDVGFVAFVACQVLSALDAAHKAGIVHRDLKSDNIFLVDRLQRQPDVKLLDFGISMFVGAGSEDYRLTQTGQVLGTPYYMSPEQTRGVAALDHRTDLFSLGVIIYECLAGRLPFRGENIFALAHRIQTATPEPISSFRPQTPRAFEHIVEKAMAKSVDERWSSASAMLEAIYPFVEEQSRSMLTVTHITSAEPELPWLGEVAPRATSQVATEEIEQDELTSFEEEEDDQFAQTDLSASDISSFSATRGGRRGVPLRWVGGGIAALAVALVTGSLLLGIERSTNGRVEAPRGGSGADADVRMSSASSRSEPADAEGEAVDTPQRDANDAALTAIEQEQVTVTLLSVPDGALITLDGLAVDGEALTRPSSEEPHTLRIELGGHEPWERRLSFTESITIDVELVRRRGGRGQRMTKLRTPPSPPPLVEATPTKAPPVRAPQEERDRPGDRFGAEFE